MILFFFDSYAADLQLEILRGLIFVFWKKNLFPGEVSFTIFARTKRTPKTKQTTFVVKKNKRWNWYIIESTLGEKLLRENFLVEPQVEH